MTIYLSLAPNTSIPPRELRHLRRTLPSNVGLCSTASFDPRTTHLVLEAPAPTLHFICAAAASIPLIKPSFLEHPTERPEDHALQISADTTLLPASLDALWAGRVWPACHAFWRRYLERTGHRVLHGHRVVILGNLKPRGQAGLAAPSNAIVKSLLLAAGAEVVKNVADMPTFAIVAPGLDPTSFKPLKELLEADVLCLASAFLVDLIARAHADPKCYVMFESQREHCGPVLGREFLEGVDGVLPICVRAEQRSLRNKGGLDSISSPTTPDSPRTRVRARVHESNGEEQRSTKKRRKEVKAVLSFEEGDGEAMGVQRSEDMNVKIGENRTEVETKRGPALNTQEKESNKSSKNTKAAVTTDNSAATGPPTPRRSQRIRKASLKAVESHTSAHGNKRAKRDPKPEGKTSERAKEDETEVVTVVDVDSTVTEKETLITPNTSRKESEAKNGTGEELRVFQEHAATASCTEKLGLQNKSSASSSPKARRKNPSEMKPIPNKQELSSPAENLGPITRQRRKTKSAHRSGSSHSTCAVRKRPRSRPVDKPCPVIDLVSSGDESVGSARKGGNARSEEKSLDGKDASTVSPTLEDSSPPNVSLSHSEKVPAGAEALSACTEGTTHVAERVRISNCNQKSRTERDPSKLASGKELPTDVRQEKEEELQGDKRPVEDNEASKHTLKEKTFSTQTAVTRTAPSSSTRLIVSSGEAKRDTESRTELDLLSGADAISEFAKIPSGGVPTALRERNILTVEDGYHFLLQTLGGEPSKRDLDSLFQLPIRDEDGEVSKSNSHESVPCSKAQSSRRTVEQSPAFEDEDDNQGAVGLETVGDFANPLLGGLDLHNSSVRGDGGGAMLDSQNRVGTRSQRGRRGKVDILAVPVPSAPIRLKGVLIPSFVMVEDAQSVPIQDGNAEDDRTCQSEVEMMDWVVGAESLVGLGVDDLETPDSASISSMRRLCLSLAESSALLHFASSNRHDGTDIASLTGICVRLLHSEISLEMSPMLVDQLLLLRDKQIESGFDSLAVVASADDKNLIPFRHKALATIWGTLIQEADKRPKEQNAWSLFNRTFSSRLANMLAKSVEGDTVKVVQRSVNLTLEAVLAIGYTFAVRPDFCQDPASIENDQNDWRVCPDNWQIVSRCLDEFTKDRYKHFQEVELVFKEFLIRIVTHVAGRVWHVSEQVLSDVARTISSLATLRSQTCYCVKPALLVSRFQGLAQRDSDRLELGKLLKTPCDCFFFLSWLYLNHGSGNAMRRAMIVMRKGASLTTPSTNGTGLSRVAKHHVGLVLAMADNLATSGDDGEHMLCRTLTSKCPRLESITENMASRNADGDTSWRATLDGIDARCRTLVARRRSIHTYVNWLSESIFSAVQNMKKTTKEKQSTVADRETLRIQDSVFTNLALQALQTIQNLASLMHSKAEQEPEQSSVMVRLYVDKCASNLQNFVGFAGDVLSQITCSPDETVSKSKGALLQTVLSVIATEIKLVSHVFAAHLAAGQDALSQANSRTDCDTESFMSRYGFIMDGKLESLLLNVLRSDVAHDNYDLTLKMKVGASNALSQLLELQGACHRFQYSNDEKRKVESIVVQGGLDGSLHVRGLSNSQQGRDGVHFRRVQNHARIEFWKSAFSGSWGYAMMHHSALQSMVSSVVMIGVAWLLESNDEEYKISVRKLVQEVGRVNEFRLLFGGWSSSVHVLGSRDGRNNGESTERCDDAVGCNETLKFVEGTLSSAANHWASYQATQLVQRMRETLHDVLEHSSELPALSSGLIALSHVFRVESQMGGFRDSSTHMGWLQQWTGRLTQSIQKLSRHGWRVSQRNKDELCRLMQQRIMGGLCMVDKSGRDVEARIAVVRLVKALIAVSNSLDGMWDPAEYVVSRWLQGHSSQRAERNVREWHQRLFHAAVADPLSAITTSRTELAAILTRFARVAEMCVKDRVRLRGVGHEAVRVAARLKSSRHYGLVSSDVRLLTEMGRIERAVCQLSKTGV